MNKKPSEYLIPATKRLPGLIHFYAGVPPEGSAVQVSVWDSEEHAAQLDRLEEMTVDARAEACGVTFHPIVNYPPSVEQRHGAVRRPGRGDHGAQGHNRGRHPRGGQLPARAPASVE
jgi:hypothetical protein